MEVVILSKNILIAYASRNGSTKEIATTIGKVLEDREFASDVLPSEDVVSLNHYHATIIGSAVYSGNWLESALELLESFQEQFTQMPVWLFSSGPAVKGDPSKALGGWHFPKSIQAIVDYINPKDIKLFAGKIDAELLTYQEFDIKI